MRIPNPRLVRLGGLTKGAVIEPGDAELQIPPVYQGEFPSPLSKATAATGTQNDSFLIQAANNFVGVHAQGTQVLAVLSKGLWRFQGDSQFQFLGTSNAANFSQAILRDPDGLGVAMFQCNHAAGHFLSQDIDYEFLLDRDGWQWEVFSAATVLGDVLSFSLTISGMRML